MELRDVMKSKVRERVMGWRATEKMKGGRKGRVEVTFEEEGRCPLLRGVPGEEEKVADEEEAVALRPSGRGLGAAPAPLSQVSWLHEKANAAGLIWRRSLI